ncbi:non-ribosomal peptide synthetase [Marilutibacter chinensis]|uniref:Amino acid adenylation domain-containing protein n=1 Tax=Marilutibacter chinensis TaxID=2912247 RepID=A0ABS9HQS3_9GAMM|nr:non-ribosomal peptide synthetase [Lysobacter chinensis]MCF7220948.1 amino acid adenylation domain-containing protein [Lysobacter chinensis]
MNSQESASFETVDYDPFAQTALERVVPVTEPQREVWLADKLGREGSLAYNESVSLRLRGPLDPEALRQAVQELVQRHESLRATVGPDGDELYIAERMEIEVGTHDLGGMDVEVRETRIADYLKTAVETPFDLEQGPLFRADIFRIDDRDHLLVMTAHHIVCDGWSFGVIARDIASGYRRLVAGERDRALAPAQSFAEYAAEQAAWMQSAQSRQDEQYWLGRLGDPLPTLDLPLDRPRPRHRTFVAAREDVVLDAGLVAAVRKLGARHGASLFSTLLTGFSTLLRRLGGQTDLVVGIAAAGQANGGHDELVGHCVNILPVRLDVERGTAFSTTLELTAETLLDAFEHQRYTFGTLLRKLAIPRDPSRLPLVSVLFNLDQKVDDDALGLEGLSCEFSANARSHENFELFVNAVPAGGAIRLECQYNTDLYDAATIRRWMAAFAELLRSAVADPGTAWDRLGWLDAEQKAALSALQPAPTAFDPERPVQMRFADVAAASPDRIAIVHGLLDASGAPAKTISYGELDRRSNALARVLQGRGLGAGDLVGICMRRDPELYTAVLAVLKAGAAYVPLDPDYPPDRLKFMAEDAGLACVIELGGAAQALGLPRERVLALDADIDAQAWSRTGTPRAGGAGPESPAYVIYTSGSTGRPKGVVVPHRALVNLLTSMSREPGLGADDRLVAVTTTSFDMSVPELFLPLVTGAGIVMAGCEVRDSAGLRRLLECSGATAMQATPSGWRVLLESGWSGGRGFKALIGGESVPQELAVALRARCGSLWNMYGPTETTVWSTCACLDHPERGITIGRPIANTSVWVLDEHGQPCPVGVPGEIYIGGAGVTLGYLNRPELTRERFLPDPFSAVPGPMAAGAATAGDRIYRTGDRGRWRNDGTLEHLGRLDFQVKVRGYRIELGEVEANLAAHPGVAHCAVIAREDRPGDVRLVGYVVLRQAGAADEESLLEHLRRSLPAYMVPQHLVFMPAIPLSPNGKVDRKALPAPSVEGRRAPERVAPRTGTEREVATLMEQVLALPGIGVDDDFFSLGGHSLLAAQLTARINRQLGVSLSMRALFDAPTVAGLAALIERGEGRGDGASGAAEGAPVPRLPDRRRAPLSLMQERLFRLERFNPGQVTYNTPSAHRLTGPMDVAAMDAALRALAQRQTVLRTGFEVVDGEEVQIVHDDIGPVIGEVEDLSGLAVEEREQTLRRRIQELIHVPFERLDRAPLFVVRLFRLREDEHVLFFMPHHLIWDGWSFDVLYAELSELYAARCEGREPVLPELPVSYGDFSAWHRGWVQGPGYARQLAFWRERISAYSRDRQVPKALPTDHPRRRGMSGEGRSITTSVPSELTARLHRAGLDVDATLSMVLLTAYCVVLARMSGQYDQVVGTPVRGRNAAELEHLMGYFTTLLPLHVRIDPEGTFADAVRGIKAEVLDSFANPDVRLEDLAADLSLRGSADGNPTGSPMYQSLFSFQDARNRPVRWGALSHSRVPVLQPGATEDIGLWFVENAGGLIGGLVYNAEIYEASTAERIHRRYLSMLEAIAGNPRQLLRELARFDDGEPLMIGAAPVAVEATGTGSREGAAAEPATAGHVAADAGTNGGARTSLDPKERYLAAIWEEMLGIRVRPDDNFFDLGGNSMQGMQMAERVARETGLQIKLVRLASQGLSEIAVDLPADPGSGPRPGFGARLKRLFGGASSKHVSG